MNYLKKVMLAQLPTPLHELPNLTAKLDFDGKIYIKRDDLTGLAAGGNKSRKLEYLMAEALDTGCDTVITAGGNQSNHCIQTVCAAKRLNMDAHVVLSGKEPDSYNGNLLLDKLAGAIIHFVDRPDRDSKMIELGRELEERGKHPYIIPVGGSNALGGVGYTMAMFELVRQLEMAEIHVDRIVSAASSGGTLAGMVLGAKLSGFKGIVTGISIDRVAKGPNAFPAELTRIGNGTAELLGVDERLKEEDFNIEYDYLGAGYAVMGESERLAISTVAGSEGIFLGPVYTGRAMGAVMDIVKKGRWKGETILFWHTGDTAALFDYNDILLK